MSNVNQFGRHLLRRDTSDNWKKANPILRYGELVVDTTLNRFKLGDGVNNYNSLPYVDNELYRFIDALIRIIGNLDSGGKLLDSVETIYDLKNTYSTKKKNVEYGDLCFVRQESRFYCFKNNSWKPASSLIENRIPVDTKEDLYTKYPNPYSGLVIYVLEDNHYYQFDNTEWRKLKNDSDDIVIKTVTSIDDLVQINNPYLGQIVYVISKKKHYFYNGLEWTILVQ